eukprot:6460686-Amphidinium_carterae.6
MAPKKKAEAATAEHESVVSVICERYGKASVSLTKGESTEAYVLYDVCQDGLSARQSEFVLAHETKPILVQYSQDSTPMRVRVHAGKRSSMGSTHRSGMQSQDMQVQCVFLTAPIPGGEYAHCCSISAPVPIMYGKQKRALMAMVHRLPGLFGVPLSTVAFRVRHIVCDRAISHDVCAYVSGSWMLEGHKGGTGSMDDSAGSSDACLELHSAVGCSCHDGHNALKWSQLQEFEDPALLRGIHVSMTALRSGFMKSFAVLEDWLLLTLSPVGDEGLPSDAELRGLWCSLSVSAELLEPLLSMKLLWRDGRLLIREACMDESGWAEKVSHVLMSLWTIPAWTASRWLTVGSSARGFVAASLLGFEHMFKHLRSINVASDYDMHGYDQLDEKGRRMMASTALVSFVSESFLGGVLADSRVALNATAMQQDAIDEVQYLECLDMFAWVAIAGTVPMEATELRHIVLKGSLVSLGYLQERVFNVTGGYPWCLVRGDVESNVRALLLEEDAPDEQVAAALWACGRAGMSVSKLTEVVVLLGQASFSSHLAEKLHASAATIRKFHPELGPGMLCLRGFYHAFRQLLPVDAGLEKKKEKRENRWNAFLADIVARTTAKNKNRGQDEQKIQRTAAVRLHSKHFSLLSEGERLQYQSKALVKQGEAVQRHAQHYEDLESRLDALLLEESSEAKTGSTMLFSNCCLFAS